MVKVDGFVDVQYCDAGARGRERRERGTRECEEWQVRAADLLALDGSRRTRVAGAQVRLGQVLADLRH